MNENASRSDMVISGIDSLEEALARHRTEPEYTMQAVAQRTGVPPDTLRSWERRHGFPTPARTDSNRRLYSERDIAAVNWLRDQTERGQGVSEAVHMLLSRLDAAGESTAALLPEPKAPVQATRSRPIPIHTLEDALFRGKMAEAQSAWDHIAIAVSPEALASDVVLPVYHSIRKSDLSLQARHQASAFLTRKATVLLDHAGPDRGMKSVCLAIAGRVEDDLPATILATVLSRHGYHILTQALDIATVEALDMTRQTAPDRVIVVAGVEASRSAISAFARLLPDQRIYGWASTEGVSFPHPVEALPNSLSEVAAALT